MYQLKYWPGFTLNTTALLNDIFSPMPKNEIHIRLIFVKHVLKISSKIKSFFTSNAQSYLITYRFVCIKTQLIYFFFEQNFLYIWFNLIFKRKINRIIKQFNVYFRRIWLNVFDHGQSYVWWQIKKFFISGNEISFTV